jgi:hypothetical protein
LSKSCGDKLKSKNILALVLMILVLFAFLGCTQNTNGPKQVNNLDNNYGGDVSVTEVSKKIPVDININKIVWFDDSNLDYKLIINNEVYSRSNGFKYSIENYSFDITSNKEFNMKLVSDILDQKGEFIQSREVFFHVKSGRQLLKEKSLGTLGKRGFYNLDLKGYDEEGNLVWDSNLEEVKIGFDYNKNPMLVLDANLTVYDFSAFENSTWKLRHKFSVKIQNIGNTDLLAYLKQELYLNGSPIETLYNGSSGLHKQDILDVKNYDKLYYIGLSPGSSTKSVSVGYDALTSSYGRTAKPGDKLKMVLSLVDIESDYIVATVETPEIIVK